MSRGHKQLRRKLINFVLQRLCLNINRVDSIFGNAMPRVHKVIILTLESRCLIMKKHRHGEELAIHEWNTSGCTWSFITRLSESSFSIIFELAYCVYAMGRPPHTTPTSQIIGINWMLSSVHKKWKLHLHNRKKNVNHKHRRVSSWSHTSHNGYICLLDTIASCPVERMSH